jgi:hypothetical protein
MFSFDIFTPLAITQDQADRITVGMIRLEIITG